MIMLYFSGTGNSKYIAEKFSERMGCACHSIEEKINFEELTEEAHTVAVCYPIYASCVPRIMRNFVKKHPSVFENKKLVIFCTQMMFSGDGARAFARLVRGSEKNVIYAEHFSMPNNISNTGILKITERERIRKKRDADRKLDRVCSDIKHGVVRKRGWNGFSKALGKMQNGSWYKIEEKQKSSFKATDDCIKCGLCVKNCPVHNLTMGEKGVVQHNRCVLCYRCVNICPKRAATVLNGKRPEVQYKGVERK